MKFIVDIIFSFMYTEVEMRWVLLQNKLIAWRQYYGITQKEMAKKLKIDVRTYINKEKGVTQFKADEMFMVASILKKEIGEIFSPSNFMEREVGCSQRKAGDASSWVLWPGVDSVYRFF